MHSKIVTPRQRTDSADMVMMFVGYENRVKIAAGQTERGKSPLGFLAGKARIDQKATSVRLDKRTISPATTG